MRQLALVAMVAACGGSGSGSGVDGGKLIATLTATEQNTLCEFYGDNYPRKTVMCGADTESVGADDTVADCVSNLQQQALATPSCTATVTQAEDCFEALYTESAAMLCSSSEPAACAPIETAACAGTS